MLHLFPKKKLQRPVFTVLLHLRVPYKTYYFEWGVLHYGVHCCDTWVYLHQTRYFWLWEQKRRCQGASRHDPSAILVWLWPGFLGSIPSLSVTKNRLLQASGEYANMVLLILVPHPNFNDDVRNKGVEARIQAQQLEQVLCTIAI